MPKTAELLRVPLSKTDLYIQQYGCGICKVRFMVDGYLKPSYCPGCGARFEPTPET
jgi:uncharacterized CHY-type Zn-finger protein